MLQPGEIKKEKSPLKCTCKQEPDEEAVSSDNARQVLVNFGLNRKKVFTLSKKKEKLHERFKNYILSEPAFSELLEDSYVVFQEFCPKFRTWVDVDVNETLQDGTVLNAVFFPSNIERDESNPGSLRKKDIQVVNVKAVKRRSEIIHIDLEEDENVTGTSVKNSKRSKTVKSSKVKEQEEEDDDEEEVKRKKIKKSTTKNEIVTEEENKPKKIKKLSVKEKIVTDEETEKPDNSNIEEQIKSRTAKEQKNIQNNKNSVNNNESVVEENLQNTVESKPKKAKTSKTYEELNKEEANRSAKDQTVNLSQTSRRFDVQEAPKRPYCNYPENGHNSSGSKGKQDANRSTRDQYVHYSSTSHQYIKHKAPARPYRYYQENHYQQNADNFSGFRHLQNRSIGSSPGNSGESYISKIHDICVRRHWPEPEFSVKKNPFGGFSCELKLNNKTYIGQHRYSNRVREAAAEEAYSKISYKQQTPDGNYNHRSW